MKGSGIGAGVFLAASLGAAPMAQASPDLSKLPLVFEENRGQTHRDVRYVARSSGATLYVTEEGALVSATGADSTSVRLRFTGSGAETELRGEKPAPGHVNYLRGDPSTWRTRIPVYGKVRYDELYEGIDLVFHGSRDELEFDYVVEPGIDPSVIGFVIEGEARIAEGGDLVVGAGASALRLLAPIAYQEGPGGRDEVPVRFEVEAGDDRTEVAFAIGEHDPDRELVIDPVLIYSSYLGGTGRDAPPGAISLSGIAVDGAGNAYVATTTDSLDYPVVLPALQATNAGDKDAVVTKVSPDATSLVYSTYLGGSLATSGRPPEDGAADIVVDAAGSAYVVGFTQCVDFPIVGAPQPTLNGSSDIFVVKLSPDGTSIEFSTYLGGSGGEVGRGIALGPTGDVYVVGDSQSNFPVTPGALGPPADPDGRLVGIARYTSDGSTKLWSGVLGGNGFDQGWGIDVDSSGRAHVIGTTSSSDFPTTPGVVGPTYGGVRDGFLTIVSADGTTIDASTYLGGSQADSGVQVALGATGIPHAIGTTESTDFPVVNAVQPTKNNQGDAWISRLSADLTSYTYSTFLGGNGHDGGISVAVDGSDVLHAVGIINGLPFPFVDELQTTVGNDGFLARFDPTGALIFSTPLGGEPSNDAIADVAVDAAGSSYLTGTTASYWPTTPGVFQPDPAVPLPGFSVESFVAKVGEPIPPCAMRTDYDEAGCNGTFQAFSTADLATYVGTDFGRNGGSTYQNLKIMADLTDDQLDIESPCTITLLDDVVLAADFVSLDGREGVNDDNGYEIHAVRGCVLSERQNAGLGAGSVVVADELTVEAHKTAKVGQSSDVDLTGALTVRSTGDLSSSNAIIKSGSTVEAGSVRVEASRSAHVGENVDVTAGGAVEAVSTGDVSGSKAGLKQGSTVDAGSLFVSASREAKLGQSSTVITSGEVVVISTGSATGSLAIVKSGAATTAGTDMDLVSGNKATIGQNTTVTVTGDLEMTAQSPSKCTIKASATITAGSTSGNCF